MKIWVVIQACEVARFNMIDTVPLAISKLQWLAVPTSGLRCQPGKEMMGFKFLLILSPQHKDGGKPFENKDRSSS